MALTKISTGGVKDDAASQAKIADEAIDEARLQISNAGTNGQFLQKQSGSTGGLTWAAANEYSHPNHSGEVTSTGDGATVIASNVVDEDNLKISNAGTNGQYLQKQSGNTGGLTWADVTVPPSGNTVSLVADGAIAAGKPCVITTAGKAKQITEEFVVSNPPSTYSLAGSRLYFSADLVHWIASDYGADTPNNTTTGLTLNCWIEPDDHIRYRFTHWDTGNTHTAGFSTGQITSSANASGHGPIHCRYIGDGYWLVMWPTGDGSTDPMYCRTVRHNGDLGPINTIAGGNYGGTFFDAVRISDTRTVVTWRSKNSSIGGVGRAITRVLDWSSSGTGRDFSSGANQDASGTAVDDDQYPSLAYDSTNNRILLMSTIGGAQKIKAGTISGDAGSGSISWGSYTELDSDAHNGSVTYDATNNKIVAIWKAGGASASGALEACVITTSNSDNSISAGTVATSSTQQNGNDSMNSSAVSAGGLFARTYMWNTNAQLKCLTVSGTTVTWQSGGTTVTNSDSRYPIVNYNSKKKLFEIFREKTNSSELYGHLATTESSSSNNSTIQFIGFAPSAISDGATGTINTDGNIIDGQSGLTIGTRYFVQQDGSLATSSQAPNYHSAGGLAIAADKLLIRTGATE